MVDLVGQERLSKIGQLNVDICNLRHELDGAAGYEHAEDLLDSIERSLLMKEIQLCAAENGIALTDEEALDFLENQTSVLESAEYLDDALIAAGLLPEQAGCSVTVTTTVKQGICPICGHEIELDELLSPFITQYPEVFRYHCPECGATGTQTVSHKQTYPVQHSNVVDGRGRKVIIQEQKPKVEPTIPVSVVKNYLLSLLDDWDKLGDRKYELPNMQVYNHIRTELDDLEKYCQRQFPDETKQNN